MAVTVVDVALDLRLIADADEALLDDGMKAILTRHLGAAEAIVEARAPSAPDALADAATIALAAYMFDRPSAPSGSRFASAWANSGAAAMLARYVRRRARSIGVGDDAVAGRGTGGPGVDAVARQEAADAAGTARDALALAGVADGKADSNAGLLGAAVRDVSANRAAIAAAAPDIAEAKRLSEANVATIQEFGPRLTAVGDVQSVMVGTAANFAAALEAQVASNKPLWLVADAAFDGQIDGAAFPVLAGEVYWFAPGSNSPEALFTIPQGGGRPADLSAYRTAADQDVIDNRATAGILLARQEARAADGKAVAAQEAIPADVPDAPAAAAQAVDYVLRRPAAGSASTETLWTPRATVRGLTDAQAVKLAGITVNDETAARAAADAALGKRIDAFAGYAAPVFDPAYWVKSGDARSILVHLDPRADAVAGLAKVRLSVQGVVKTLARVANQDVYAFAFTAADAANITRAAGNAGSDTVHADVSLLDRNDARVLEPWRGLLRVLDAAPGGGGGGNVLLFDADVQTTVVQVGGVRTYRASGAVAGFDKSKYSALLVQTDQGNLTAMQRTDTRAEFAPNEDWGGVGFDWFGLPDDGDGIHFRGADDLASWNLGFLTFHPNPTFRPAPQSLPNMRIKIWGVP